MHALISQRKKKSVNIVNVLSLLNKQNMNQQRYMNEKRKQKETY